MEETKLVGTKVVESELGFKGVEGYFEVRVQTKDGLVNMDLLASTDKEIWDKHLNISVQLGKHELKLDEDNFHEQVYLPAIHQFLHLLLNNNISLKYIKAFPMDNINPVGDQEILQYFVDTTIMRILE